MSEHFDFENEQEMSVHDKEHAALGPTEGSQDVGSLDRLVVPPGAYLDPNNPNTINNTVNVSVNDAPNPVAADYGQDVYPGQAHVQTTLSGVSELRVDGEDGEGDAPQLSKNREEWTKADWQSHAKSLGVGTSGSMDKIRERVEAHESQQEETANFVHEVQGMNREELDKLAEDYNLDPSEYSRKEDLAEAIVAAETGEQ